MKHILIYVTLILFVINANAVEKSVYFPPNITTKIDDALWISSNLQALAYYETYEHLTLKNASLGFNSINYYNQSNLQSILNNPTYSYVDSSFIKDKAVYNYKGFIIRTTTYRKVELTDLDEEHMSIYHFSNQLIFHDRVELVATHIDTNYLVVNLYVIDGRIDNKTELEIQLKKIIDNTTFISPKAIDIALGYPVTQKHQQYYAKNYTDYIFKRLDLLMRQLPNDDVENSIRELAEDIENYLPKPDTNMSNSQEIDPNYVASIWWEKATKNKLKFNSYMDSLYVSLQKNWKRKHEFTPNNIVISEDKSKLDTLSIQEINQFIKDNLQSVVDIKFQEILQTQVDVNNDINGDDDESSIDSVIIPYHEKIYEPEYDNNPFRNNENAIILFQNFALPEIGFSFQDFFDKQTKIMDGNFTINEYLNNLTDIKFPSESPYDFIQKNDIKKVKNNLELYKEMPVGYDDNIIQNAFMNKINKEIFKGKYKLQYISELGSDIKYIKDKTIVSSIWFLCSPNAYYDDDTLTDYIILSFTKNGNQWQPSYSILNANFGANNTEMPGVSFSENANGKDFVVINYDTEKIIADKKNHALGGWTTMKKDDSIYYNTYPISFPACTFTITGCGEEEQMNVSVYETIINSTINPDLAKINELIAKNKSNYKPLYTTIFHELKKHDFDFNQLAKETIITLTYEEQIISEIDYKFSELQKGYCADLTPNQRVYTSDLYFDDLNADGKDEVFYFSISNGKLLEYFIYTLKNNKVVKYENTNALKQMQNTKSYKLLEEKSKQETEEDIAIYSYEGLRRD